MWPRLCHLRGHHRCHLPGQRRCHRGHRRGRGRWCRFTSPCAGTCPRSARWRLCHPPPLSPPPARRPRLPCSHR
ncbi:hypothetical protein AV530_003978 [Patagioenas fasciata monilis]|uniref:Uncharacterized protein n=1 Tax=Patagioenas fasciata monilis TaxID=372326 RepID=A0A1V4K3G6_PATFA|nr:hypothetical protein AV530_003978 [Patagioenas fasciata monilis]